MGCKIENSAVIILAAGVSGRMGFPKPLLRFGDDESFLEHIINIYAEVDINQIVVVVNSLLYNILIRRDFPFLKQIDLVLNPEPERGRLFSLRLGLEVSGIDQYCFIQNADQPFIDTRLLYALANEVSRESYSAPVFGDKGGHPVLLGPDILPFIANCTDDRSTLVELLNFYPKKKVLSRDKHVCFNINSAEDYKKYFGRTPETV